MSCMFGVSPRPLTISPFSVSAVCLLMLFLPWSSATSFAITSPLVFRQGPLPMRSRALTAPDPWVLRYACHVLPPAPAAWASVWQVLSAPARPPRSAPFPEPALVMKKLMLDACACATAAPPSHISASETRIDTHCLLVMSGLPAQYHTAAKERPDMSRPTALAATLLAVVLLATTTWAQAPRDVVVVGMEAEPPGLDPGQALGLHTLRVTAEIFETLVATPDDSTEIVPGLAESWTTSSDGLTWTFKLRKSVRFHDGTPVDAAAVKFTFDRVIDPAHPQAKSGKWSFVTGYLSSVKSVETLDPHTVQLHLKYPTSSLLALLALPNCAIVSPTAFTRSPVDFDTKPVGSGRYRFESCERGSRLVLRRNDDYWGDKGKPQTLVYRGIAEANARVTELLTGGVDLILPIPPDFVARLEKTSGVTVHKKTGLTVWYVGFNVEKKPFTDRRVRQAFNHAVNKDAIVRDILKGTGIAAVGPLLPGTWAFEPNVRKYAYEPAAARKLLADAGYPTGLEVDFWVPESGSGMQAPVEMATVIQANLAAVGVKASLKTFEWGSYLGKIRADAPAMFALSWFLKSEDPDLSMYPLFFSKNQPLPNRSNYNNPEVDQLLVQARQVADRGKRAELYRKAQRLIVEDAPWLFVDHEVQVVATRANVKGFKLHPSGFDLRVEQMTKE